MKYIIPILETERLILKQGNYEDYVKVYEYDFTRLRNIGGEFEYVKNDPEKLRGYEVYSNEDNVLDFIVYLKNNSEPIGNITLDSYDEKLKSLEVSINIHPSYWKKGYATETMLCVMGYVFENLDIENIIYGYADDNYKSKGLSDKLELEFYKESTTHYARIDKDVKEISMIMTRDRFRKLYSSDKQV